MTCRRYLVTGRVQGVAFRHSTVVVARELGLTGWCRNLADGSVEVCACGDEAALSQLNAWLHQGPPAARVDRVESAPVEMEPPDEFEIRSRRR